MTSAKSLLVAAAFLAACSSPTKVSPKGGAGSHDKNLDGHLEYPDAGVGGGGGGGASDGGIGNQNPDLAKPPTGGGGGGGMTGCNGCVLCVNACAPGDTTCTDACLANTTTSGTQILNNLLDCLDLECPGLFSSDPCYDSSSAGCDSCYQTAQAIYCSTEVSACQSSTP